MHENAAAQGNGAGNMVKHRPPQSRKEYGMEEIRFNIKEALDCINVFDGKNDGTTTYADDLREAILYLETATLLARKELASLGYPHPDHPYHKG
jgi:hypothetical protein